MFKLLAMSSVINMFIGILTNLKSLIGIAVNGTLVFLGYLLYNNGMDISLAFGEVSAFWLSVWDFAQHGWAWLVSVLPF